jgi:hypothetical protein
MLPFDRATFRRVLDAARSDAKARQDWAWANALERAQRYLKAGTTTVTPLDAETYALTSPQSGATYHVNGTCQRDDGTACPAFADGRPCWHLAAKTLVAQTLAQAAPPAEATEDAPTPLPPLIPLQVGTVIVDYAESESEATRWFREHEVYFLGLDVV